MINFLDTSAILNYAYKVYTNFYVSAYTIRELENIKNSYKKDEDIKRRAREALRFLNNPNCSYCPNLFSQKEYKKVFKKYPFLLDINDHYIIAEAALLSRKYKEIKFITSDYAQLTTAKPILEITYCKFFEETSLELQTEYYGWKKINPTDEQFTSLYTNMSNNIFDCLTNEYVKLYQGEELKDLLLWNGQKYENVKWQNIRNPYTQEVIKPRNVEQKLALNLLQNKQIPVKMFTGKFGSGKAQPVTTLIPTPEGMRKLGDIQVGDYVFDRLGNPTKVLGVFPQGILDCYKITFNDGRTSYCNDEHIWSYYGKNKRLKQATVREMLEQGIYTKNSKDNNVYRYRIPLNGAVNYSTKNYEIDPYVIGCFAGDGCCLEKALTISSNDEEIVSTIAKLINAKSYKKNSSHNYNWSFYLKDEDKYKNLVKSNTKQFHTESFFKNYPNMISYAKDKAIPEEYLYGDVDQRFSLLQGLMDTDGSIDSKKGRLRFFTTSIKLKEQVKQLVWSLGYLCFETTDTRVGDIHKNVCYGLSIGAPVEDKPYFFRLTRKKQRAIDNISHRQFSHSSSLSIRNIEKMPYQEEMVCLYVDNEEHLYLTNDYIVTHNTYLTLLYALDQISKGHFDKIIFIKNNLEAKGAGKLGTLPGSELDKLSPWLKQIEDIIGPELYNEYINEGIIEPVHLSGIRGRNFSHSILYVDEAENLTRQNLQLLISRVGENSEIILCGDWAQTDYFKELESGLKFALDHLKGNSLFGAVRLIKTERSAVANLADNLNI